MMGRPAERLGVPRKRSPRDGEAVDGQEPGGVDGSGWGVGDARALELAGAWPPAGAQPIALDDAYERFADIGIEYGPVFQGLQGSMAPRRGDLRGGRLR